jgi:hypothetical protein
MKNPPHSPADRRKRLLLHSLRRARAISVFRSVTLILRKYLVPSPTQ